jgi:histidinol-phosphate aminotransferase
MASGSQVRRALRIRKMFGSFEEYGWETPSHEIAKKVGLRTSQIVRLDTNTSPFVPKAELKMLSKEAQGLEVNQYPDTTYLELRKGLSRYCGLDVDRFVVTNGADEGLDIISKTLLDNGDEVVIPAPTYSMFRIVSEVMGAKVRYIRRRSADYAITPEEVLSAVTRSTKVIFLCNPNSPTGNPMAVGDVERIVSGTRATVAVDEAYYEFWGESSIPLTEKYDNLVVCRTFSKAFSMAGVRVGYLVADRGAVDKLNLVRPPNSLSVISLRLAEAAIANLAEMRRNVVAIKGERERVLAEIGRLGLWPYPSVTNFILFRVPGGIPGAKRLHSSLMKRGLVIRSYSDASGIGDCLRLTIGTRDSNDRFLTALESLA